MRVTWLNFSKGEEKFAHLIPLFLDLTLSILHFHTDIHICKYISVSEENILLKSELWALCPRVRYAVRQMQIR